MAKNKGKVIQMLSPENYIRKKARMLPIYECWLNNDWEVSGAASIIIARRHTNENITFYLYLVDLYCLGVKDSFYSSTSRKLNSVIFPTIMYVIINMFQISIFDGYFKDEHNPKK